MTSCDPLVIEVVGKKNYLPPTQLMLCFGFMFKVCTIIVTIATAYGLYCSA